MEEDLRRELEALCQFILSNNRPGARREQLSRVQLLYEKLTVLQYLEAQAAENAAPAAAPAPSAPPSPESLAPEPSQKKPSSPPLVEATPPAESEAKPAETPPPVAPRPTETAPASRPAKAESPAPVPTEPAPEAPAPKAAPVQPAPVAPSSRAQPAPKSGGSLNKRLGKGSIEVGLNDRIGLVKHLFDGQQEDFNRVLSQLNTLDGLAESLRFIEEMVKPDYDWTAAEEYEERLIALVHQRFGEEISED